MCVRTLAQKRTRARETGQVMPMGYTTPLTSLCYKIVVWISHPDTHNRAPVLGSVLCTRTPQFPIATDSRGHCSGEPAACCTYDEAYMALYMPRAAYRTGLGRLKPSECEKIAI